MQQYRPAKTVLLVIEEFALIIMQSSPCFAVFKNFPSRMDLNYGKHCMQDTIASSARVTLGYLVYNGKNVPL